MKQLFSFALLFLLLSKIYANPITEKFPNGNTKKIFQKDQQGWLTGSYKEFHPNGKLSISTNYIKNKIHGPYIEYDENEKIILERIYVNGKRNGTENTYKDGQLISSFGYVLDELAFSRSIKDIKKTIKSIHDTKVTIEGDWPDCYLKSTELTDAVVKKNEECLKILMIYRYLCDVPYKNLTINREYIAKAMAANDIANRNKFISHFPPNPNMPEKDFKFASSGTASCNLFYSSIDLPLEFAVHYFMNDSDTLNREKLGHRRWCLSPQMKSTGFAINSNASSMYSIDLNIKELPEIGYFAFPPKGFAPVEYFKSDFVWSVMLNPKKYNKVKLNALSIKVKELDANYFEKKTASIELEYSNVNSEFIALNSSCIIFKPKKIIVEPSKKYKVEITGLSPIKDSPKFISYFVEFF